MPALQVLTFCLASLALSALTSRTEHAMRLAPGKSATLLWRFTQSGTYEFACLLPGYCEAGTHSTITVAEKRGDR